MPVQCRSPCSFAHVDCRNVHISCCISYQCVYDCIVSAGLTTDATACAAVCRVALETQEVAIGIMGDLADQRETIQRSRGRVSLCAGSTALLSRLFHPVPSGVCAGGLALLLLPVPFLLACVQEDLPCYCCLSRSVPSAQAHLLARLSSTELRLAAMPPQLKGMDGELSRSRRILYSIINRARRNKAVAALIMLMCLALIGIIIYLIIRG